MVPAVPRMKPRNVGNPVVEMPDVQQRRLQSEASMRAALDSASLARVRVSGAVKELASRLDDPSWSVREQAGDALRSPRIDDAEIWATLDRGDLSDEAHERLLGVARRRVMEKPRGALGIRMSTGPLTRPGVLVQATLPDMPAEKVLKAGDLIERVDAVQVMSSNDLAEALQSHAPGHEVRLVVLRTERDPKGQPLKGADGKTVERRLEITVALGDAANLDRVDPMEARAMGLPPNMPMNMNNLPLQQRAWQAAVITRRFTREPGPVLVPVPLPPSNP